MTPVIRLTLVYLVLMNGSLVSAQPVAPFPKSTPVELNEAAVRTSIERALPYIEKHGVKWMEQKKCVTCHHSTFMIWSLNRAVEHGFAVDEAKLAKWNAWTRDFRNIRGQNDQSIQDQPADATFHRNPDVVGQLLLSRPLPSREPTDEEERWLAEMRSHLVDSRQAEGNWKAGGQLPGQKRPPRETDEVTTMWSLLALNATQGTDETIRRADEKVAEWLAGTSVGVSTEWWSVRMLWSARREQPDTAEECRNKLLQTQRQDGGWGWLLEDDSDALGTGLAMYALLSDRLDRDDEAVRRAVEFLLKTQKEDGSWSVKGTKQAKRNSIEPTATYWGTCWAVIAMLESLTPP